MMGDATINLDDVPRNHGVVLPSRHVAIYRNDDGRVHALSSVCTHRGCDVTWNDRDRVWDCPCHGSRFAPTGAVLKGPATRPLPSTDVPK
jgi:Rieske Fe-S protein